MQDQNVTANGGAVNFDAGVVKTEAQQQMQAVDASPEKPISTIGGVAVSTAAPAVEVELTKVPAFNAVKVLSFVTLSYGNAVIHDMKELKSVTIPMPGGKEETFNFYNPFLKSNPVKNTHPGVVRGVLSKLFELMQSVEGRELLLLGTPAQASDMVAEILNNLSAQMRRKFPLMPTDSIMEYETDDGPAVLHFGDLFSINAWPSVIIDEESMTVDVTLNFNLVVNACAFYDSEEPHIYVERAMSFVRNTLERMSETVSLNPYLIVALNSESLQDEPVRDFFANLLTDFGFALVSRASVLRGNEDWLSAANVDKVFVDNTDILLLGRVFDDGEDDADEAGSGEDE